MWRFILIKAQTYKSYNLLKMYSYGVDRNV
jgi:hypothetical protein